MKVYSGKLWKIDVLFRLGSFWMGVHYSKLNESFCIAPLPCIVIRVGKTEYRPDPDIISKPESIRSCIS